MEYRIIGPADGGLKVSAVGLGCNNFGRRIDAAATARVIHATLDAGVTLLDRVKKIYFSVLGLLFLSVLSGCGTASPLAINTLTAEPLDTSKRQVILLSRTLYDQEFRRALRKNGFKVKRFASTRRITREKGAVKTREEGAIKEEFLEAEARYGIDLYFGSTIDTCLGNKHASYDVVTMEVVDTRINETVPTIEKGGWTGPCGFVGGNVFSDLTDALRSYWDTGSPPKKKN